MTVKCAYCLGEGRFAVGSNTKDWYWEECPYCLDDEDRDELNYSEVSSTRARGHWDVEWEPSTEDELPW